MEYTKVKLGDIGKVISGGTPSTKIAEYWDGDIPWITPKDLSKYSRRYIRYGQRYISKKGLLKSGAQIIKKNSILFSTRAPVGYIAISQNDITTNQGFKSLEVDQEVAYTNYVYYQLIKKTQQIENMASGSTFREVSKTQFENIELNLPSLEEQKRIADILTALDDKIELNN